MAEETNTQIVNYAYLQLNVLQEVKTVLDRISAICAGIFGSVANIFAKIDPKGFAKATKSWMTDLAKKLKDINFPGSSKSKQTPPSPYEFAGMDKFSFKGFAKFIGSMKMFKGILSSIKTMVPGMMQFALVTAPAQAAISGFLEIFDPFTEIFGAFGESLSLAFAPLVQMISEQLVGFIPVIISFANGLAPIITMVGRLSNVLINILFKGLTAFEPILTPIGDLIYSLLTPITKVVDWVATLTPLWDTLASVLSIVGGWIQKLVDWIKELGESIYDFFNKVDVFEVFD